MARAKRKKIKLTDAQAEIAAFYAVRSGYPPSFKEVATHRGITVRAVQDFVRAIWKKGFARIALGKSRGVSMPYPLPDDVKSGALFIVWHNRKNHIKILKGEYIPKDNLLKSTE